MYKKFLPLSLSIPFAKVSKNFFLSPAEELGLRLREMRARRNKCSERARFGSVQL